MKADFDTVVKGSALFVLGVCVLHLITRAEIFGIIIELIGILCMGAMCLFWLSLFWILWRKEVRYGHKR